MGSAPLPFIPLLPTEGGPLSRLGGHSTPSWLSIHENSFARILVVLSVLLLSPHPHLALSSGLEDAVQVLWHFCQDQAALWL